MSRELDAGSIATIDDACLAAWPLPEPAQEGDKETRGSVLVLGGSSQLGGSVVLAATAAMRAGAGKVTIATASALNAALCVAFPEARIVPLEEDSKRGLVLVDDLFDKPFDAVLIGPGMLARPGTARWVADALRRVGGASVILDAGAMEVVRDAPAVADRHMLLTPHAGELAHLAGVDKEAVLADPITAARRHAAAWNVTVALKGATTVIATPGGAAWLHDRGNAGLAMSGSGDTLAGIAAGLAARGASLEQAAAWAVALHSRAADVLALRIGPLGYLARELVAEIPALMHRFRAEASRGALGFIHDRT